MEVLCGRDVRLLVLLRRGVALPQPLEVGEVGARREGRGRGRGGGRGALRRLVLLARHRQAVLHEDALVLQRPVLPLPRLVDVKLFMFFSLLIFGLENSYLGKKVS